MYQHVSCNIENVRARSDLACVRRFAWIGGGGEVVVVRAWKVDDGRGRRKRMRRICVCVWNKTGQGRLARLRRLTRDVPQNRTINYRIFSLSFFPPLFLNFYYFTSLFCFCYFPHRFLPWFCGRPLIDEQRWISSIHLSSSSEFSDDVNCC